MPKLKVEKVKVPLFFGLGGLFTRKVGGRFYKSGGRIYDPLRYPGAPGASISAGCTDRIFLTSVSSHMGSI